LLRFFLAVSVSCSHRFIVDEHLSCKFFVVAGFFDVDDFEADFLAFALGPFDDLAFEVEI
jgi:hypothetical protein